jgi:Putative transmembrane protein (PGPGW)
MSLRDRWRVFERNPTVRVGLFVLGVALMIISPIIGALPGPGFIIVFPVGLGLSLKYSRWAKRRYVQFKRRWPKHGRWADWGLRRASAKRRAELERPER